MTHPTDIQNLIASFGSIDPGGNCWAWIATNHIQLWRDHQTAVRDSNLSAMAITYKQMLHAWTSRHQATQGELL